MISDIPAYLALTLTFGGKDLGVIKILKLIYRDFKKNILEVKKKIVIIYIEIIGVEGLKIHPF